MRRSTIAGVGLRWPQVSPSMVSVQLALAPFFILGSGEPLDGVNLVAFAPGLLRGSAEPLDGVNLVAFAPGLLRGSAEPFDGVDR